ncbi:MAG: hypothetical protein HY507_01100 [Candidatus Zambryskibacteria bacterium]|nr:hypothetical protein [Candidatus Zambryskibacteria bacterium]
MDEQLIQNYLIENRQRRIKSLVELEKAIDACLRHKRKTSTDYHRIICAIDSHLKADGKVLEVLMMIRPVLLQVKFPKQTK